MGIPGVHNRLQPELPGYYYVLRAGTRVMPLQLGRTMYGWPLVLGTYALPSVMKGRKWSAVSMYGWRALEPLWIIEYLDESAPVLEYQVTRRNKII